MSISEDLEKRAAEVQKQQAEIERLTLLEKTFPDLKKSVNRWGTVRYYSASVNSKVTDYEYRHNCGCCSDSPLEIWPYIKTGYGNVYSDPPCFTVGEKNPWNYGDRAYEGWDEKLRSANIPEDIITKVSYHFNVEDEEDEDDID